MGEGDVCNMVVLDGSINHHYRANPEMFIQWFFKNPSEKKDTAFRGFGEPHSEPETEHIPDDDMIRCRNCLFVITRPSEAIAMQGGHRHTFANPHGIVFEIGCFRNADGCRYLGAPSDEFTWFAGFGWRIALCAGCKGHLGWLFASPAGNHFNGLILDRLIFPDS